MGTTLLALLVHLDGSGAVTFLVTIPVMLPLYDRLGMDRRVLACAASLAAGVNFLPWTGPMIRASAALHIPVTDLFHAADSGAGRRTALRVRRCVVARTAGREASGLDLGSRAATTCTVGRLSEAEKSLRRPGTDLGERRASRFC